MTERIECVPHEGTTTAAFWSKKFPSLAVPYNQYFHRGYWEIVVQSDGLTFQAGLWRLLLINAHVQPVFPVEEREGLIIVTLEANSLAKKVTTSKGSLGQDGSIADSSIITIETWSQEAGIGIVTIVCDFLANSIEEHEHSIH